MKNSKNVKSIILVGEAGSGKTHHSKTIAKHFNLKYIEDEGERFVNVGSLPNTEHLIIVQEISRAIRISKLRVVQMTDIRKELGLE